MGRSRLEQANHDIQQHKNSNNQERQQCLPASALASSVNEKIVIRSLRRRLCKALLGEDRDEALRIYTATRSEWETIVCTEVEIAEAEIERRAKIYEDELKQQKVSSCNSISRLMSSNQLTATTIRASGISATWANRRRTMRIS